MSKIPTISQIKAEIDNKTRELLEKNLAQIENIVQQIIYARIDKIIAHTLGMESRWGTFEVDHCNGRQTEIANKIGAKVAAILNQSVEHWLSNLMEDVVERKKTEVQWKHAFETEFRDQMRKQIRERAEHAAKHLAELESERLIRVAMDEELQEAIIALATTTQMCGPDSAQTKEAAGRRDRALVDCAKKVAEILTASES